MNMDQLLQFLAGAGNVGIWVLVAVVWRLDKRITEIVSSLESHIELDKVYQKSNDRRLDKLEDAA